MILEKSAFSAVNNWATVDPPIWGPSKLLVVNRCANLKALEKATRLANVVEPKSLRVFSNASAHL